MEKIFYQKLHCATRTYFFNVNKNEENRVLLSIIESRAINNGQYKRMKINIREEDLDDFIEILKKVVEIKDH